MGLALLAGVVGIVLGVLAGPRIRARLRRQPEGGPPMRRASDLSALSRTQETLLAAFRPGEVPEPEEVLLNDQRILSDALREIRHRRGAVSAVLWVLDEHRGGVAVPHAWSSSITGDDAAHDPFPVDVPTRSVIEWSAREGQVGFEGGAPSPRLAVAPFRTDRGPAALSLHFDDGALVTREAMREWLPQHATMMQTWYELVRTRGDSARANFQLRAMIRSAIRLQATRDPLALEDALVHDSLFVTDAEWAALVRWDPHAVEGSVRAVTPVARDLGVEVGAFAVRPESVAGRVCLEGHAEVLPDVRGHELGSGQIFGGTATLGAVGSLVAVPLRRSAQEPPVGVLVVGHSAVNRFQATQHRNARNLAAIAVGALETAWAVEDARRNARTDPLTGLANRRGFDERFAQVVMETDRYGGTAALIMVDLDFFKRVNDTYGHDAGDRVLVAVAGLLRDGRRTVDLAARLGGEELAVLLPQTDAAGARELAERLRQRIEATRVRIEPGEIAVTASFGVGEYAARTPSPEKVLERADRALYEAKRNGRNRVEVVA